MTELRIRSSEEINIELIAGHCGFLVSRQPMQNAEGRLLSSSSVGVIAVADSAYKSHKWRFVIAHELGHSRRHRMLNQLDICSDADLRTAYAGREAEANDFASELLMPSEFFRAKCDINRPSLRDIRALATEFSTSITATALRFVSFTAEACAIVHSTGGKVDWVSRSDTFTLFIANGLALGATTHAGDLHAGRAAPDYLSQVDGPAWSESAYAERIDLFEHSMKVAPNAVLTLLWHRY